METLVILSAQHTLMLCQVVITLNYFDSLNNCSAIYSDTVSVQIGTPNQCTASFTKAKDSSATYGVVL